MKKLLSTGLEITKFDAKKDFPTSESWEKYTEQTKNVCVCEEQGYVYVAERNMTQQEEIEFEGIFMQ